MIKGGIGLSPSSYKHERKTNRKRSLEGDVAC